MQYSGTPPPPTPPQPPPTTLPYWVGTPGRTPCSTVEHHLHPTPFPQLHCLTGWVLQVESHAVQWNTTSTPPPSPNLLQLQCLTGWVLQVGHHVVEHTQVLEDLVFPDVVHSWQVGVIHCVILSWKSARTVSQDSQPGQSVRTVSQDSQSGQSARTVSQDSQPGQSVHCKWQPPSSFCFLSEASYSPVFLKAHHITHTHTHKHARTHTHTHT